MKITIFFIFHPPKHKHNWKIVSTINVTYAPTQINWARNTASNYLDQQQPSPRSQMLWFFSVSYVINSGVQPENITMTRNQTAAMNCYTYIAPLTMEWKSVSHIWRLRLFTSVGLLCHFLGHSHQAHRCMFPHFRPPVTLLTVSWFCCRSWCRPVSSWCRVSLLPLVVHHLELKARKNCRHRLVRLFQLVTKASHHIYTAQLRIGDFVHLLKDPNWLKIFMMGHSYLWHLTISLLDNIEKCLLPAILESKHISVSVYFP